MPHLIAALTMLLLIVMVIARVQVLRRQGIAAMQFGRLDKTDFLIPPFAFFYIYCIFAAAFDWPSPIRSVLFDSSAAAWAGVALLAAGLLLFLAALISFGTSFRVGIDTEHPDRLITTGVFAWTRNPIYVAFGAVLAGQFLILPHTVLLVYLLVAIWLFHRQVLREETFLRQHYAEEFAAYCRRVRRYL